MKNRHSESGFTLAELLIVVAIIAVLVAVSIPIFTRQLEKARESTDIANFRAAKAEAVVAYLSDEFLKVDENTGMIQDVTLWYDAASGKFVDTSKKGSIVAYGKGTSVPGYGTSTPEEFAGYYEIEMPYDEALIACNYSPNEGILELQWRDRSSENLIVAGMPGFVIKLDTLG